MTHKPEPGEVVRVTNKAGRFYQQEGVVDRLDVLADNATVIVCIVFTNTERAEWVYLSDVEEV